VKRRRDVRLRLRHRLALVAQQFDWRRSTAVERESNGTFSAWVAGLPGVYAAADTAGVAKRGIRRALAAHLDAPGLRRSVGRPTG
jgi:predicted RNase H-like HicB family nuclease